MLNPFGPDTRSDAEVQRDTFWSDWLEFGQSWGDKSQLWELKLNTFSPTTLGCLKECSSFLSRSSDGRCFHPLPPQKEKKKKTGLCGHTFALAGVALFTSFADSLNFQFALVTTDEGARRPHVRNAKTRTVAAASWSAKWRKLAWRRLCRPHTSLCVLAALDSSLYFVLVCKKKSVWEQNL